MKIKITTVAKVLPKYTKTTEEILPFLDLWLAGQEDRFARKVKKIFENAGVDRRYSIMPAEAVFTDTSFEKRNNIYKKEVTQLGKACLQRALAQAGWEGGDLDYIITVSCTGFMIPSMDAYLINELKLKQDIIRLPVTEMGCVAGVSGLIYAKNFLKSNPGKRAAVVAVESPSSTFQPGDYSMTNIVSAAIFGDGAACALLSSREEDTGPEIIDEEMYHFYHAEQIMGFDLTDAGLKMVLDIEVPNVIEQHFERILYPFLDKNKKKMQDIDHFIFHPGGKKIIQKVESLLSGLGKNINITKEILRLYGNMSSATILYVLESFLQQRQESGTTGLMLSFGPGFTAQKILLQW
ncbi:MAG TPA: 3-oxoacyl-[acyl-carrier-protein] synthase III C-terminal domain-containing protein [Arachidicoccus sp.]|nr:3-oxoacyl-[acyl-carrier-protein] synthase III C-terminal domain-containing protein [Arachidicoccus sp.]